MAGSSSCSSAARVASSGAHQHRVVTISHACQHQASTKSAQCLRPRAAATNDPQALTLENVERTLDELRPFLMADGGNVEVVEIDGPIVKVRLQGACGSCPSAS